eukprot:5609915-Amphidinium_carterae.1
MKFETAQEHDTSVHKASRVSHLDKTESYADATVQTYASIPTVFLVMEVCVGLEMTCNTTSGMTSTSATKKLRKMWKTA